MILNILMRDLVDEKFILSFEIDYYKDQLNFIKVIQFNYALSFLSVLCGTWHRGVFTTSLYYKVIKWRF